MDRKSEADRFKCDLTLSFHIQPFPLCKKEINKTQEGRVIHKFLYGAHYTDSSQCPASLKEFKANHVTIEGEMNEMVQTPFTDMTSEQSQLKPQGRRRALKGYRAEKLGGGSCSVCREGSFGIETEQCPCWLTEPFVVRFQPHTHMLIFTF